MKKISFSLLLFVAGHLSANAQTNTFPTTGNVGIGTLAPASALEVVGTGKIGGAANNLAVDANGNLSFNGNAAYKVGGNKYAFQFAGNPNYGMFFNQASVRYELRNNAAAATFFVGADNGNGYFLGNLGLGVTTATTKLDVAGAIKIADGSQGAGKVLTSDANGLASWQTPTGGGGITGTGAAGNLAFWTGASALGTNANLFWDNLNARLGIGTATPVKKLDISGSGGLRVSSTNNGSGTTDWIAGNYGATAGDRVVMGNLNGKATIGAHNNALTAWAPLIINQSGGNVAIGTATPATGYLLTVTGKIMCTELKVQLQPFPDYVFDAKYKLLTLAEVENHINTYHRLPGMPGAAEVESNGMEVGKMQGKVIEKVEELTLYIIRQQKQIETLQQLVEQLQQQVTEKK